LRGGPRLTKKERALMSGTKKKSAFAKKNGEKKKRRGNSGYALIGGGENGRREWLRLGRAREKFTKRDSRALKRGTLKKKATSDRGKHAAARVLLLLRGERSQKEGMFGRAGVGKGRSVEMTRRMEKKKV